MSSGYASIIARRLLNLIDESDTCEFPSITNVAAQLNVSRATAAKAARILRNEGILSRGNGRRYVIIKAKNISGKKPALRAAGQAAVRIREYTGTAEARERVMLPVMGLMKKLGYSRRTVCDALRMLVKEGAVEKYGRYYAISREKE